MAEAAQTATIRYRAFLSYSHRDTKWAKWLHAALEGYRIDKDLAGRKTPVGPVPKTLAPASLVPLRPALWRIRLLGQWRMGRRATTP